MFSGMLISPTAPWVGRMRNNLGNNCDQVIVDAGGINGSRVATHPRFVIVTLPTPNECFSDVATISHVIWNITHATCLRALLER